MTAFRSPHEFAFVPELEARFDAILAELDALAPADFRESPDSLTTVSGCYDESGWRYFELYGEGAAEGLRARCPATARACAGVPDMRNAGFSWFRPKTHLYPHRGEIPGVLRCHLPLRVPRGDVGLCIAGETRRWQRGRCLVFDDTLEHEAWNHADRERVVLIVTFGAP